MKYEYNEQFYELNIKALDSMPLGMILPYAGDTIPNGYLMCTGQAVSRTEYADLYNVIGEIYGSGDGSTTFNLPDLGGRVPVGLHYGETEFLNLGQSGGSKYLQAHTHNTTKKWANPGTVYGYQDVYHYSTEYTSGTTTQNSGDVASGVQTGNSGNLQPYLVVHYIIKAKNTVPTMASIVNEASNSTTDGYSCGFINEQLDGINTDINDINTILDSKENKFLRGSSLTLNTNVSYFIVVKPFTIIVDACAVGVVLGGFDIKWIYNNDVSVSHNGNTYSFTSGYGACGAVAIPF